MNRLVSTIEKSDFILMSRLRSLESKTLTFVMISITKLGDAVGWVIISFALMAFAGFATGLSIGLSALFGALSAKSIKHWVQRCRPCTTEKYPKALISFPDPWSFPSGHTCTAFAVATFVFLSGYWAGPNLFLFACCMASSRVYLGVHYPSDVLVGGLLGIISGWACFWMMTPLLA